MIHDHVGNVGRYFSEESRLMKAIRFAQQKASALSDGDHWLEEGVLKASLQSHTTSLAEERLFERHREFIDVQVMIEGVERHDVTQNPNMDPNMEYDIKRDMIKFHSPDRYSTVILEPGYFVVYFPQDAHRPKCAVNGPEAVRKVCMKVKV